MLCSICLDALERPVVTPCGHVFCSDCLISSCQKSQDATKAPCPTCRTNVNLVSPNAIFVPEKYRQFIDSSVRRLYLDNSAEQKLQEQVAQLEARIQSLETQKDLLMDRCESYMTASSRHAENEKDLSKRCTVLQQALSQANHLAVELTEREARRMTVKCAEQPNGVFRPNLIDNVDSGSSSSSFEGHTLSNLMKRLSGFSGPKMASADLDFLVPHTWKPDMANFRRTVPLPKRRRVTRQGDALLRR